MWRCDQLDNLSGAPIKWIKDSNHVEPPLTCQHTHFANYGEIWSQAAVLVTPGPYQFMSPSVKCILTNLIFVIAESAVFGE